MKTKVVLDSSGTEHEVEWHWYQSPSTPGAGGTWIAGDWWPEIETVDGEVPEFSAEMLSIVQDACAEDYPLGEHQNALADLS